jgi:hypothetical protein
MHNPCFINNWWTKGTEIDVERQNKERDGMQLKEGRQVWKGRREGESNGDGEASRREYCKQRGHSFAM